MSCTRHAKENLSNVVHYSCNCIISNSRYRHYEFTSAGFYIAVTAKLRALNQCHVLISIIRYCIINYINMFIAVLIVI